MFQKRSFTLAITLTLLVVSLLPGQAFAGPERITRGDAEAVLNAFLTGGRAVWLTADQQMGSVVDEFGGQESIRPLPPYDNTHYCVEDWHVILLGIFEGGDPSFKHQDAIELLAPLNIIFFLDGNMLLDTKRTSIMRFLNPEGFGWEKAYGFQEGQIMSPEDLSIGTHTLNVFVSDGTDIVFENWITFYVDPPDSTTCTG